MAPRVFSPLTVLGCRRVFKRRPQARASGGLTWAPTLVGEATRAGGAAPQQVQDEQLKKCMVPEHQQHDGDAGDRLLDHVGTFAGRPALIKMAAAPG